MTTVWHCCIWRTQSRLLRRNWAGNCRTIVCPFGLTRPGSNKEVKSQSKSDMMWLSMNQRHNSRLEHHFWRFLRKFCIVYICTATQHIHWLKMQICKNAYLQHCWAQGETVFLNKLVPSKKGGRQMDFVLSPSQHAARLIQCDPICIYPGKAYQRSLTLSLHIKFQHSFKQCISNTCTSRAHYAPPDFHVLIHNPKHQTNVLAFTCCLSQTNLPEQTTNTHTHTHIHTCTHTHNLSFFLPNGNNEETRWQCQAAEKGSQTHWSAICGTNGFATHPRCLTDSQIPGRSWRPVGRQLHVSLSLF